jgi:hypothetical protein
MTSILAIKAPVGNARMQVLIFATLLLANGFQTQNSAEAKKLNDAKNQTKIGDKCTGLEVVCAGLEVAQCANDKVVLLSKCSATLSCQVLRLRLKPGTLVTCTTDQEIEALKSFLNIHFT